QSGIQNELQRRFKGRQDTIGYRVDNRFENVSFLLYVKYVVVALFFLAAALLVVTRGDPFSLISTMFVVLYAVGCSATVEGDWARFFVPIHNVMAMVGVAGIAGWVGSGARVPAELRGVSG
ncbi:MAG: hypothetical protein HYR98_02925, partial [Nitrospirae bacterium]|nr:hypothetical protein [Nitrospirota bacterium]